MTSITSVDEAVRHALTEPVSRGAGRIVIGYSGGLDSTVLLYALVEAIENRERLLAIHVNHGLSRNADDWQRHCESISRQLRVECIVRRAAVPRGAAEAVSRRARYEAFSDILGVDDVLWLAHHMDDQAETVLWRLLRGGGAAALAGMPVLRRLGRGHLLRPLLDVTRAQIEAWAVARKLGWIDDDSNADLRFTRNYVRHEVLPTLLRRWPDANVRLLQAARRFKEEAAQLRSGLDRQLDAIGAAPERLPVSMLDDAHARPVLRRWLERAGITGVRERVLNEILRQAGGAGDRVPKVGVANGVNVRRYRRDLFIVADTAREFATMAWTLGTDLHLPGGRLTSLLGPGPGLRADVAAVEVRARRGGERLRPLGRDGSRSVKRLLQEAHIPPWWRVGYPLIYVGDHLVAVPAVAIDESCGTLAERTWQVGFESSAGTEHS